MIVFEHGHTAYLCRGAVAAGAVMVRRPGFFGRFQHFLPEPVDELGRRNIPQPVQSANPCRPEDLQRAGADVGEHHIRTAMLDEHSTTPFPINNASRSKVFSSVRGS